MNFPWDKINEFIKGFLALPAGKQVVGGLVFVAFVLGYVIVKLNNEKDTAEKGRREEVLKVQQACADTVKILLQRFDHEKSAMWQNEVAKLEKRAADREADLDAALMEARKTISTQRQAKKQLQKITTKVSKIVHNANQ